MGKRWNVGVFTLQGSQVRNLYLPPLLKLLKYINHLGCFQDLLFQIFHYASLGSIFFAYQKLKLPASCIALKWIELAYKKAYAHASWASFSDRKSSLPSPKQRPYSGEASSHRNRLAGMADRACVAATTPVRDPFTASTLSSRLNVLSASIVSLP